MLGCGARRKRSPLRGIRRGKRGGGFEAWRILCGAKDGTPERVRRAETGTRWRDPLRVSLPIPNRFQIRTRYYDEESACCVEDPV